MEQQGVRRSSQILNEAVKKRDYEAVKNLLQTGTNASDVDDQGDSHLHTAVVLGELKIVEILVQHNAQMDIENNIGYRPLDYAIVLCRRNIIKFFLQYKLEVRISNIKFVAGVNKIYPENIKKLLYENVNVDHVDPQGYTALYHAVKYDDLNGIKTLISRGADVNKGNEWRGSTPLHVAKSKKCMKMLLQAGAEPNVKDEYVFSPLETLVRKTFVKCYDVIERKERRGMIEELVMNGANCIEIIDGVNMGIPYGACPELIYCLEDVLRFMALKDHGHHYVNIDDSMFNFVLSSFYRQCLNEIVLLKEEKLLDNLTYYDFATKNIQELSKHFDNESFKKAFKIKSELMDMFPIYNEILWSHFEEAREERKLFKAACSSLNYAIPCHII